MGIFDKLFGNKTKDLIRVALKGHNEIVKILLDKGANVNVKNEEDGTALTYAMMFRHTEIVYLLKQAGAKE